MPDTFINYSCNLGYSGASRLCQCLETTDLTNQETIFCLNLAVFLYFDLNYTTGRRLIKLTAQTMITAVSCYDLYIHLPYLIYTIKIVFRSMPSLLKSIICADSISARSI